MAALSTNKHIVIQSVNVIRAVNHRVTNKLNELKVFFFNISYKMKSSILLTLIFLIFNFVVVSLCFVSSFPALLWHVAKATRFRSLPPPPVRLTQLPIVSTCALSPPCV